jgi:hypothetical protein
MTMEEANKSEPQDCGLRSLREVFEQDPTRNIIDFESGRRALQGERFADEQSRVKLMQRSRLASRLPEDWLEFLLTFVLFAGSLVGVVGEFYASWRS